MSKLIAIVLFISPIFALADVQFSTGYVEFGQVQVNSSRYRSVYLRNSGREVARISLNSYCYGDFGVSNGCFGQLNPGSSCNLGIRFNPRRAGRSSCRIEARDGAGGWDSMQISGTGYEPRRR